MAVVDAAADQGADVPAVGDAARRPTMRSGWGGAARRFHGHGTMTWQGSTIRRRCWATGSVHRRGIVQRKCSRERGAIRPSRAFTATGGMGVARTGPTATLLPSGRSSSPALGSGVWRALNCTTRRRDIHGNRSMTAERHEHTRHFWQREGLIVGGGYSSAELYDQRRTFAASGSMTAERHEHTATLWATEGPHRRRRLFERGAIRPSGRDIHGNCSMSVARASAMATCWATGGPHRRRWLFERGAVRPVAGTFQRPAA